MKKYLDKKAKMLTKKREAQSDAAKNNPHFDSTQPSPSGRNKYEEVVHEKKEMIKVKLKDPSKIKVKVTDIGPGGKEYVRKNEKLDSSNNYFAFPKQKGQLSSQDLKKG